MKDKVNSTKLTLSVSSIDDSPHVEISFQAYWNGCNGGHEMVISFTEEFEGNALKTAIIKDLDQAQINALHAYLSTAIMK